MSINVNVTGNPVSIKRGKMVAVDPDYVNREFQKRRLIRLQQVRQQSRDIAETVRNKVRKAKNKQLGDVEKQGEREFKKWQTKKLLHLQQQYNDCLKDIGLGHSEAVLEEESDYAIESRKESYDQIAKERGDRAVKELHKQRLRNDSDKSTGDQKRRYKQAMENTRSKMVAGINKKKNKTPFKKKERKVATDINISSRVTGSSDTEEEVPQLLNLTTSSSGSNTSSSTPRKLMTKIPKRNHSPPHVSEESTRYTTAEASKPHRSTEHQTTRETEEVVDRRYVSSPTRRKIDDNRDVSRTNVNYPVDTRISDRIRSRTLFSSGYETHSNICDNIPPVQRCACVIHSDRPGSPRSPKKCVQNVNLKTKTGFEEEALEKCYGNSKPCLSKDEQEQIPNKPTVTLRTLPENAKQFKPSLQSTSTAGSQLNKVQYYDHKNRYTKEYVADNSSVQKIPDDSIQVCPSSGSEAEFVERMYKRDHDAQVRGQKALEKLRVHRDYQEMMQQLPLLQKQERIAAIPSKKPTFHMSEDRLKQLEKRKQNRMENAYEKLFPNARLVTIPPKVQTKSTTRSNLPFQTVDVNDNSPTLNIGYWDTDKPKSAADLAPKHVESELLRDTAQKVLGESTDPDKATSQRRENLQKMLKSLTFHRDKLAKELSELPENSDLHKRFSELGSIDELIRTGQSIEQESSKNVGRKRSRNRKKQQSKDGGNSKESGSSLSPTYRLDEPSKKLDKGREGSRERERKTSKYHIQCTSGSSTSPSPPSKILSTAKSKAERKATRPPPLILQNMSTQTTPTVEQHQQEPKRPSSGKKSATTAKSKICDKNNGPCDCYLHTVDGKGDLCQIVIKFSEGGKPQICVSPTKLKDKQIIVKTEEIAAVSVEPILPALETKKPEKPTTTEKSKAATKAKLTDKKIVEKPKVIEEKKLTDSKKNKAHSKMSGLSWGEYLSQNSTSSTSYFSPPDFTSTHLHPHDPQPSRFYPPENLSARVPKQKPTATHLINILKDQPQQSNVPNASSTVSNASAAVQRTDSHLLCYIKKLLTMSRMSIEELSVSSVSEISTPTSSVMNIETNNPSAQLQDLKHFNLNMSDVLKFLNYSPDGSNVHYNTVESLTLSSSNGSPRSASNIKGSNRETKSQDVRETSLDDYSTENYPGVLAVYNKLAESCAKKIENLTAMIEKVRLEKINMLQSPGSGSDKENSTKYLDLPPELRRQKNQSSNNSVTQEELDRQMLEIDYSFAERLKKMTPAEIREQFPLSSNSSNSSSVASAEERDSLEKELMVRFKNLVQSHKTNTEQLKACTSEAKDKQTNLDNPEIPFVPLLIDIPRLPKFEAPSATTDRQKSNEKSKPPTSKGLTIARRFNNNISLVPHELSTIVESESLISNRLPESRTSNKEGSPRRQVNLNEELLPIVVLPTPNEPSVNDIQQMDEGNTLNPLTSSSDTSLPDILTELMKSATTQIDKSSERKHKTERVPEGASDSSPSELENMEAMLKSLGMGWAIATMRKTQEALALTSSSSSVDISLKQKEVKVTDTSNASEISLRDILGRQFLTKPFSSKSDNSTGSSSLFLREFADISAIQGSERSYEITTRRTSTPVQSSKTPDKSKNDSQPRMTITGESELSSVRANSDCNCDDVPFYSLNESSVRSKSSTKDD